MMPLEVGNMFVDRHKSAILLSYLAKSTLREKKRELRKEKLEVGLRHLKHLDTAQIQKHLSGLEHHLEEAKDKQDWIESRQKTEDSAHQQFNKRLDRIHEKLSGFLEREQKLQKKVKVFEKRHSAKHKKAAALKQSLRTLKLVFNKAKDSGKYSKTELNKVQKRIENIEKQLKDL
ncbi:hypothetical protein KY329_01420 [Candidatus Woesearchaeota archaeon]|nr:hypothetical protein [Candidatus Woesearchaeota archaeon]